MDENPCNVNSVDASKSGALDEVMSMAFLLCNRTHWLSGNRD